MLHLLLQVFNPLGVKMICARDGAEFDGPSVSHSLRDLIPEVVRIVRQFDFAIGEQNGASSWFDEVQEVIFFIRSVFVEVGLGRYPDGGRIANV